MNILDEVNMYFPIGSFRSFSLPVEELHEIIFIRTTRDRLKLVLLTPTIISIWLTKVIIINRETGEKRFVFF